jgi:hypothetical protein
MQREPFAGFFDDAALFPPGNAPMGDAVPAHIAYRNTWFAELVGPFLCPDGRLAELRSIVGPLSATESLETGLIVPGGSAGVAAAVREVAADPRLRLAGIEVKADAGGVGTAIAAFDAELPTGALGYVEVARGSGLEASLDALAEAGYRPKFRTGGLVASAFPSEDELGAFIVACRQRQLTFKLTAGLHHAVRHTAEFEHHGFLNVLVATMADNPAEILARRDGEALAKELTPDDIVEARRTFGSLGTCSIAEPVDDLRALGFLPEE